VREGFCWPGIFVVVAMAYAHVMLGRSRSKLSPTRQCCCVDGFVDEFSFFSRYNVAAKRALWLAARPTRGGCLCVFLCVCVMLQPRARSPARALTLDAHTSPAILLKDFVQ
jgi:hypothetical protein